MDRKLDKFRGCLIGGAAGDALGYPVEFWDEDRLREQYGDRGITTYRLRNAVARISDDTQMTLFTANGLLSCDTRASVYGMDCDYATYVTAAYREWYKTQLYTYEEGREFLYPTCWLMNVPEIFAVRAPGNTCMSAISAGCTGTIDQPENDSCGCGGVMRVAPVGLYLGGRMPATQMDRLGADFAAMTHGHEMGYIPAALLTHIVALAAHKEGITLKDAVLDGMAVMKEIFPNAKHLPKFLRHMEKAIALSESDVEDLTAIHALGGGWLGDDALAIAVYCALKYVDDFDRALIAAVNHKGDSDSTGAITGNILGAYLGASRIPGKYLQNLELLDVITEIADDLYYGCPLGQDSIARTNREKEWDKKYLEVSYAPNP